MGVLAGASFRSRGNLVTLSCRDLVPSLDTNFSFIEFWGASGIENSEFLWHLFRVLQIGFSQTESAKKAFDTVHITHSLLDPTREDELREIVADFPDCRPPDVPSQFWIKMAFSLFEKGILFRS